MKNNIILIPLTKQEIDLAIRMCYFYSLGNGDDEDLINEVGQLLGKLEELEGEL